MTRFGARGDGLTDDTAAIQRALDEAHNRGGGIVCFPAGRVFRCDNPLNLDDKRGVDLVSVAGPNGSPQTFLLYTGASTPFISLRSSFSITFEHLQIAYSNPNLTGDFIEFGWSKANADPGYCQFDSCWLGGVAGAHRAASLINMSRLIISTVRSCAFGPADIAIHGAATSYSNAIQIHDSTFAGQNTTAIQNAGEAWLISGCTFEPLADGRAGAYRQPNQYSWGLTIIGCWMGDVNSPGGTWIETTGAPLGLAIINNRLSSPGAAQDDACVRLGGGQGVAIIGNRMEGPVGIDFAAGYTYGVLISGNDFQTAQPVKNLGNAREYLVSGNNNFSSAIGGPTVMDQGIFLGTGTEGAIRLASGPAPTAPREGDMWTTPNGLYVHINGQTRQVNTTP